MKTLEALNGLTDEELWHLARVAMSPEASQELEALHFKQRNEWLSPAEEATRVRLIHDYERIMLMRAQAAKLLKDRGHDISGLLAAFATQNLAAQLLDAYPEALSTAGLVESAQEPFCVAR